MYLASPSRVTAANGVLPLLSAQFSARLRLWISVLARTRITALALALVLSLAPALLRASPVQAENGLLFKQFSARYGSVTCMATPKNFRMDASELRVFL